MPPPDLGLQTRARRSNSFSSDRPSATGYGGLLSPPVTVSPDPAFIAASAASQIVTNDHDSQSDSWFDQHGIEPSGETALVAPAALKLINRFLDQLLFNFLSVSKSTSLASLRPAVTEVLKPKLAEDAINGADLELHEYLGAGDDEELMAFHNGPESSGDWDLELIWKRTRLRCMVYSSLGDMEEEDEDFWTERENLEHSFTSNPGVVSPAVAIFLTSILEFMGEQVLVVAGQTAYQRLKVKLEKEVRDDRSTPADVAERVVVDENDAERVALDRTLGRLWRGWKKRLRSPTTSISMTRSFSRDSFEPQGSRAASITPDDLEEDFRRPSLAAVLAEYELAAGIPLPISVDDVREIEIPGLAQQSDDEDEESVPDDEKIQRARPKSFIIFGHDGASPLTPDSLDDSTNLSPKTRKRSYSLPTPVPFSYSSKRQKASVEQEDDLPTASGLNLNDPARAGGIDEGHSDLKSSESNGIVAGVVSGVAAAGAVAVAGIAAIAKGEAPQTGIDSKSEVDAEEEFAEEPQIMTSSRVSIGGRVSPDDAAKGLSRRSSRSHSVHSVRVVDVASPMSSSLSRADSVDASDYVSARPVPISRPSSNSSPLSESQAPRGASPVSRLTNASPHSRGGTPLHARHSAGESISEADESYEPESAPITAVPSDLAAAMAGVDFSPSPNVKQLASNKNERTPPSPGTFVLSAAPSSRHERDGKDSSGNQVSQASQPNDSLGIASKTPGVGNGVPPLTPLRETMEVAPENSDEASSVAPSYDAPSGSERGYNGHSHSISGSTSTLPYTQRAGDFQKSARGHPTSISRSSPPRFHREESAQKVSEYSKGQRPGHTSGSSASSVSQKLKAIRTSEDSSRSTVEDKSQSFEQLIRSDETIQYTLTPENMRNIESPDSPRHDGPVTASTHIGPKPPTSRSHSSSVTKLSALRSNPPIEGVPNTSKSPKQIAPYKAAPITSNTTAGARVRPSAPQARDARVGRDSIGDFADFIRSTGPAKSYEPMPPRSVQTHRGTNGTSRNVSGTAPRVGSPSVLPRRSESSASRTRLQARDPVVPRGDSISDLIDFVRSGPQLDKDNHRIPRTVAPFRTTMDSDQMSGAVGGKAIDAALPDSRYSQASTSINSSVNSQSALLSHPAKNRPLPSQNRNNLEEEDMMPKRKTRRVRDPYAIDSSDEEDELEAVAPRAKPIQEESLADFLRNVAPPDEATTTSVFDTVPKPTSKNGIRKKSSTPSLMQRFGRRESGPQIPPNPKISGQDSSAPPVRKPSYTPIAAKFNTTSLPTSTREPTSDNYSSQVDSARNRVPRKAYQAREAVLPSSRGTDDLADFLMKTPPPMQSQPQTFAPTLHKEEASAFQRIFSRKKIN